MEKVITVVRSFDEADRADKEYYRSLSPIERLAILLELNRHWPVQENAETIGRRVFMTTR